MAPNLSRDRYLLLINLLHQEQHPLTKIVSIKSNHKPNSSRNLRMPQRKEGEETQEEVM